VLIILIYVITMLCVNEIVFPSPSNFELLPCSTSVPSVSNSVCGVALDDFSKSDFAKPPGPVCEETAFLEDLPRRRDLAIKRAVQSPQRARKHESKVVLEKYYSAFLAGPDAPVISVLPDFMVCFHILCCLVIVKGDRSMPGCCQEQPSWFTTPEPSM